MSNVTAFDRAVLTMNGVGAGGNIAALLACVAAYTEGATPGAILDAARKRTTTAGKSVNYASHEGVAYGALIVSRGIEVTPEDAYKFAARIGRLGVLAVIDSSVEDKAQALKSAWETEVTKAAIKKAERDAAKQTADAFLVAARTEVDKLLALRDQGVSLTDEQALVAASLLDDLRVVVGIQVGANA